MRFVKNLRLPAIIFLKKFQNTPKTQSPSRFRQIVFTLDAMQLLQVTEDGLYYPAGHILGPAQVRVEYRGEVWVASGDYKLKAERTCAPFEPVKCHMIVAQILGDNHDSFGLE